MNLQRFSMNISRLYFKSVTSSITIFDRNIICNKKYQDLHKTLLHCSYYPLQFSVINEDRNYDIKFGQFCQSKKLLSRHANIFQKNGILGVRERYVSHQPRRCFGDSEFTNLVDVVEQSKHMSLAKYPAFVRLLSASVPVQFYQDTLLSLHSLTGLPWWAIIMVASISIRTILIFPIQIYQHYLSAKLTNLKYEMKDIGARLKLDANYDVYGLRLPPSHVNKKYRRIANEEWKKLVIKENCHPMKIMLLSVFQIPIWLFISASIRNLCFMLPYPNRAAVKAFEELSVEGFGWVSNLTAIDSFYILPVILCLTNLINIEVSAMMHPNNRTNFQKMITYSLRGISIIFLPITCMIPSSLVILWLTSSTCTLLQQPLIYSTQLRRFLRIPSSELDVNKPYQHLFDNLKKKYLGYMLEEKRGKKCK